MALLATAAHAGNTDLVIWAADGSKIATYKLMERPHVKFTDNRLVVTSMDIEVGYDLTAVGRFTYVQATDGIDGNTTSPQITVTDHSLRFDASSGSLDITVYDAGGKRIAAKTVARGKSEEMPIAGLPSGVYVVSVNGVSHKIVKK